MVYQESGHAAGDLLQPSCMTVTAIYFLHWPGTADGRTPPFNDVNLRLPQFDQAVKIQEPWRDTAL